MSEKRSSNAAANRNVGSGIGKSAGTGTGSDSGSRRPSAVRVPSADRKSAGNSGTQARRNENSGEGRRYTVGERRSNPASVSEKQALVVQKQEKKQLRLVQKEQKWQDDVVRVRGGVDKIMLAVILILVGLGLIMMFSASYPLANTKGLGSLFYLKRQAGFAVAGLVVMWIATLVPYSFYKQWAPFVLYVLSAVLLFLTLFIGESEGEAKRWINIGGFFTFQPSELMKVALVLILAWYIDKYKPQFGKKYKMKQKRSFSQYIKDQVLIIVYEVLGPALFIGIGCGLIMAGRHLSGTLITGMIAFFVVIVGGCSIIWTVVIDGLAGLLIASKYLEKFSYALTRITSFFDKNVDVMDEGYQTTQAIYAIGSGGLFGRGFGESLQKNGYVAASHTDFIFAIWCEEWGFMGALFLIGLFLIFVWRGYLIATRAPDTFSMLTAFGITTHVGLQAFLNMCVAANIMPNTGISLPFFSYGGSSYFILLCEMGLLLSISRQSYRKKRDLEREQLLRELG